MLSSTPEELVTEMTMNHSALAHLVVEGESDWRLFEQAKRDKVRLNVVVADGCDEVIAVIHTYSSAGHGKPACGVIDRDYRVPLNEAPTDPNVFMTSLRDVECEMFQSSALDDVLVEHGSSAKLHAAGGVAALRDRILCACESIGSLRYVSKRDGLNLTFADLNFEKFVDRQTLSFSEGGFVAHFNGLQGGRASITKQMLADARLATSGHDYFTDRLLVCSGHDLVATLSIGLRRYIGTKSGQQSRPVLIEGYIRAAYVRHMPNSALYQAIQGWLNSHGLGTQNLI